MSSNPPLLTSSRLPSLIRYMERNGMDLSDSTLEPTPTPFSDESATLRGRDSMRVWLQLQLSARRPVESIDKTRRNIPFGLEKANIQQAKIPRCEKHSRRRPTVTKSSTNRTAHELPGMTDRRRLSDPSAEAQNPGTTFTCSELSPVQYAEKLGKGGKLCTLWSESDHWSDV